MSRVFPLILISLFFLALGGADFTLQKQRALSADPLAHTTAFLVDEKEAREELVEAPIPVEYWYATAVALVSLLRVTEKVIVTYRRSKILPYYKTLQFTLSDLPPPALA